MRFLAIVSALLLAGCQSLTAPLAADSLPAPLTASGGQARFPVQSDDAAAETIAVVDAAADDVDAAAEAPAADDAVKSECKRPAIITAHAVGNPCETTRSFMESQGMTEEQIARVLDAAAAH